MSEWFATMACKEGLIHVMNIEYYSPSSLSDLHLLEPVHLVKTVF